MSAGEPSISQLARAKINLTLHVGAVQSDGYHPLHSLVVFADIGDGLSARKADEFSLEIDGTFGHGLSCGPDNLVLRTAHKLVKTNPSLDKFTYKLTKNMPIASGIGGGSADAAAVVRLFKQSNPELAIDSDDTLLSIGADVSVCVLSKTCLMEGVGEKLTPLPGLGQVAAILVNPGVAVSTGVIFSAFDKDGKPSKFALPKGSLLDMAKAGRNDLQEIAIGIAPIIQTALDEIQAQENCQLARMSGSGATCFGLFETWEQAKSARAAIKEKYPDWWCTETMLGDMP